MTLSLACLGDVMLARGVSETLARCEPAELWGDLLPVLAAADLRLANLECCISDSGRPFDPPRVFSFRAIPKAIDVLRVARIDVVTLANNHSLDWGPEALLDTLGRLERAGIAHVGAGATLDDAARPVVLDAPDGTRVGVVAFADHYLEYAATPSRPGTCVIEIDRSNVPRVIRLVELARAMGADRVVVTAHWGPNMRTHPTAAFRDFARAVMDGGADAWFGHSAHILQGVEFHHGRPIVYDGGDFLDDYAVDPELRNDRSLLWTLRVADRVAVEACPVQLEFARTTLARGETFGWTEDRLAELCAEMGTAVRRADGRLALTPA